MINNLDFLNKNILRNYPIQQGATRLSNQDLVLPNFVIAGISLTIPTNEIPFISQVAINGSNISVAVSTTSSSIGYFQGILNQDFQTLTLNPSDNLSSGFLITGQLDLIQSINAVYTFSSNTQSGLEISSYSIFTPPGVTKLIHKNMSLTGNISLGVLSNLTESTSGNTCNFIVTDNSTLLSIADKSSQFMNCDTPVIKNINGAVPYPIDSYSDDANIYLFGIEPVVFTNETDSSTFATINIDTTNLDLNTFCTLNGTPMAPLNPEYLVGTLTGLAIGDNHGYNNYYSRSQSPIVNYVSENNPEYLLWPYFVTTYSLTVPSPTAGTYAIINPTGINGTISRIYAITNTGTVTFNIKVTSTTVGGLSGLVATANGLVVLATGTNTFITTDAINFNITATSGTPSSVQIIVFYSQQF